MPEGQTNIIPKIMLNVSNLSLQFGKRVLFDEVNIKFTNGNCYGIIGANGAGKSTFLKILSGEIDPTSGQVSLEKGKRMSVLEQNHFKYDEYTVLDTVLRGNKVLYDIKERMDALYAKPDFSEEDGIKAGELGVVYEEMNGWNAESDAATLLSNVGIDLDMHYTLMGDLDNKAKVRILIAQALFGNPDVLILDEPTNELDVNTIQWLEDFLKNQAKAVMVISHDRTFVDNITNRTIEVTMGRIYDYKAKYSDYLVLRQDRRIHQQKAYDEQQKFIAENKLFIERFRGTFSKTEQVQSRVRMLEKLDIIEVDEVDTSALKLKFPAAARSGQYPVVVENLDKSYGDHIVFKDANMVIERGQKVALVGKNGEGKSTMIKAIMNEIDFEGKLEIGHNTQIGYFAQNQAALLDEDLTIFETVDRIAEGDIRTQIKNILGAFMFKGDDIDKKVKVLSGGEKTRLAMVKLLLEPYNVLILDEPTNHLDMKTKDIIKDALKEFEGTVILVSHDRDFLDGLAEKVFEFGNKRVKEHFEDIKGFLATKKMENLKEIEK